MIVGSVSAEVYRRIEEHARKAAVTSGPVPAGERRSGDDETVARTKHEPDRSCPIVERPDRDLASAPNPWDTLRVGARVLAAYWNEKREFEGQPPCSNRK